MKNLNEKIMVQLSNKVIAKNTLLLFVRTLLIMGISLYTSRVVLSVLGVEDYGIYNVVGGIVSMLAFLNSAMVQASQRYLSFTQGMDDIIYQKKIFSTTIHIHITIAVIVVILLETIGLWYVNNNVVLPSNRLYAANVVYQISILIFLSRIIVVPYTASVIAHEKMEVYAYISILDYVIQLGFVFLLKVVSFDKLILYSTLMLIVAYINFLLFFVYSKRKFPECIFQWKKDWSMYKEMFGFSSWAFCGGAGFVARNQGVNLIINIFCGPAVNAARGVAFQVSAAIQTLISSFQQSMNPQIVKRYAVGDKESMLFLVRAGSKYSFLLLLICFLPILVRPNYVLSLWLGKAPEFADGFLVMAIIMTLINSMGGTLDTAMQATGNIKLFQIVVSIIMLLDLPLAYCLLLFDIEPYMVTSVSIFTSLFCLFAKILLLHRLIDFNLSHFFVSVVLRNAIVAVIMLGLFVEISQVIPMTFWGLVLLCILSLLLNGVVIYIIGLESSERKIMIDMIQMIIIKVTR